MKCPMCGSEAVYAYPPTEHMYSSVAGEWRATMRSGDVVMETLTVCECGWTGEVKDLEKVE